MQNQTIAGRKSSNELLLARAEQPLEAMKHSIVNELGVKLGAEATARANGSVGGEMTKRMVAMAQQALAQNYRLH